MKKYIKVKNPNEKVNFIKTDVYYLKDGWSRPRGYYLSVTPVYREDRGNIVIESFTAYTGYKMLLLEVARASNKQYEKAVEMSEYYINMIISRLKEELNIEVENDWYVKSQTYRKTARGT